MDAALSMVEMRHNSAQKLLSIRQDAYDLLMTLDKNQVEKPHDDEEDRSLIVRPDRALQVISRHFLSYRAGARNPKQHGQPGIPESLPLL